MAALEGLIKYFFARDLLNYARLMSIHLAKMNELEHTDPTTWHALKYGEFVVAKLEIPYTNLITDQSLVQEIKLLKKHGGIVGMTQIEAALNRMLVITPYLTHLYKMWLHLPLYQIV